MKVGVVGASGYVGGETLRLLVNHPQVEITMVTSRQHVGEYLHRVQPSLKGFTDLTFSELDYDKMSDNCDLVFHSSSSWNSNRNCKITLRQRYENN